MFEQIGGGNEKEITLEKDGKFGASTDILRRRILDDLSMYELPGEELTERDVDRYLESGLDIGELIRRDASTFFNNGLSISCFP